MSQTVEIVGDRLVRRPHEARDAPAPRPPAVGIRKQEHARTIGIAIAQALEDRRLFVLLPFVVIAGLVSYVEVAATPEPAVLAAGGVLLSVLLVLSRNSILGLRLGALAAAFWIGFSLFAVHGALFGTPMLSRPAYGKFQATIDEILSNANGEQRVIVSSIAPLAGTRGVDIRKARVFVRAGPDLQPGDVVEAPFRFYQVPGPAVPGSFDAQFHSYFDGIGAYATTNAPPVIVRAGDDTLPARVIEGIRRGISARLDAVLAEPAAGVARAIINGDQSAVTVEARQVMSTAGLAHVLSISGLHLTLAAGGVYFVLRLLFAAAAGATVRLPAKRLAAIGGMVSALGYYAISGGNVAALRSTIMILLVFGATVAGRRALTMRNVAIAGLLVILSDPASVFRPSFQLSFAAVIALIGTYESYVHRPARDSGRIGKLVSYFAGIAVTSLVAGTATLLFSVYHFQQTSPLGVVGNLLTLPLVGFVMMPAALVAVLAMPLGLEWLPVTVMGWSVDCMLGGAAIVAALSTHLNASPLLTPLALIFGLAGLAWFAFFKGRWRLLGPVLVGLAVPAFAVDKPPDVLIADTTQAVAIRTDEGLGLASGKATSFAVEIWKDTFEESITKMSTGLACDSLGCFASGHRGYAVALVRDPSAFGEDCQAADLVVTRLYAPKYCRALTTVVDAGDLLSGGVHWLRWLGDGFEVRPAIADLNRPWRAARR